MNGSVRFAPPRSTAKPVLKPAARIISVPTHRSGAALGFASETRLNADSRDASTPVIHKSSTTSEALNATSKEMIADRKEEFLSFKADSEGGV